MPLLLHPLFRPRPALAQSLALAVCTALGAASPAIAQPRDESPQDAYDRRVLSMLLDSCKKSDIFTPLASAAAGLRRGWIWRSAKLAAPQGTWLAVNVASNQVTTYAWEDLAADATRVRMPLALPRDLGSCAIVTGPGGRQRLQVVSSSVLIRSEARELWNRATAASFAAGAECRFVYPDFTVVADGQARPLPACTATHAHWSREAVGWLNRSGLR